MPIKKKKTLNFDVSADIINTIKHMAVDRETNAATLYRQALQEFIERHNPGALSKPRGKKAAEKTTEKAASRQEPARPGSRVQEGKSMTWLSALVIALVLALSSPSAFGQTRANLDMPAHGSTVSGIGLVHGWACYAQNPGNVWVSFYDLILDQMNNSARVALWPQPHPTKAPLGQRRTTTAVESNWRDRRPALLSPAGSGPEMTVRHWVYTN